LTSHNLRSCRPENTSLHNLILLDPAPPGSLTTPEIDRAMAYAEAERAPAARNAYASDRRDFAHWCAASGATPLPAHVGIIAAYLSSLARHRRRGPDVKRYAAAVGLDPAIYSGHSLRAGLLTSAAEAGASAFELAEVSRHTSLDMLRGYVRRVDLFREHAGAAFL
jgi:hypothetical protein